MKFGVGQAVRRTEDVRFVTGRGQYTDDIKLPGMLHGVVIRSPHAHARVKGIDAAQALKGKGVRLILTAADLKAEGVVGLPRIVALPDGAGKPIQMPNTPQPVLAEGRVRYVGAPVAFLVAETLAEARDAAELVEIDYEPLDAVGTIAAAIRPGAPLVWDEVAGNIVFDWRAGDEGPVKAAFARAAHIVSVRTDQNRLVVNPMEPRAAVGEYHAATGSFTLRTPTQGSNNTQSRVAQTLGIPKEKLRVITPDVGGSFGMKGFTYPEQILTLIAAKRLGKPVKWASDRAEAFLSDAHGRGIEGTARLALDKEGRILALEIDNYGEIGAFQHQFGVFIPTHAGARIWGGVYKIPAAHARVRGVYTNTMGVDAYRGAGRPEGAYMIERLIEEAGRVTGLGTVEIRRRNFIQPTDLPHTNWRGITFESGEFDRNLTDALRNSGFDGFAARRAAAKARGKLLGIGLCYYVEITGNDRDQAEVRFTENGGALLIVGTQSNGQGHETTFAQVLADQLGIPFESITVVQGDTDIVEMGSGTGGSKSLHMASGATGLAVKGVIDRGAKVAAHLFETSVADISFDKSGEIGLFRSGGTNKSVSVPEIAIAARRPDLPAHLKAELGGKGIDAVGLYKADMPTLPNGCHIAEVEIDPETGVTRVTGYWVVDDFGKVINPLIVEGQVQGGVAQGLGQALIENCVYDAETGQLMTGSFMDYGMPRADDMPEIDFKTNEIPVMSNPLGMKGCGEAGTVGALAAITNAALDALRPCGVDDITMPLTPERVWRAINKKS